MSLTERLIRLYMESDRQGLFFVIGFTAMREVIEAAAKADGYTGRFPWETGDQYEKRRQLNV